MKLALLWVGRTQFSYISQASTEYFNRIKHYMPFEQIEVPDLKSTRNMTESVQRIKEGQGILKQLRSDDFVVLLDDKGKAFTSKEFASWVEKMQLNSIKRIVFVIGGAYGFSPEIYERANMQLSLSKMTFSHQIIRAIFAEQLYRVMTILRGEPYHHEESGRK